MKKKILLILIIVVVFLTGCTSKSQVVLNEDGTVDETVTITDNNDDIATMDVSKDTIINNYINKYIKVIRFRGYDYEKLIGKEESGVTFTNSYDNICAYFQDTAFNQYVFKHVSCTENDEYYEIKNDTDYIPYCNDCSDWPRLDNTSLTIKTPFRVSESNADKVSKNSYTWTFGKDAKSNSIYLKVSKKDIAKAKERYDENQKIKSGLKITIIIVIVGVIVLAIYNFVKKLYNKYESNKEDY